MATSTLTIAPKVLKGKKVKVMASANMNPVSSQVTEDSKIYSGTVTKKQDNVKTGDKIEFSGKFYLPLAQNIDEVYAMCGNKEDDVVYWFNHGRKLQARVQTAAMLGLDFDDEEIQDRYNSFKAALENLLVKGASQEKRDKAIKMILSMEDFEPLREALDNIKPEEITVDYSKTELKRPGKPGRPEKKAEAETEVDKETAQATE